MTIREDSAARLGAIRRALDHQCGTLSAHFPLLESTIASLESAIASLDADARRLGFDLVIFAPPVCVYEYDDDRDQ